jgi:hypothetical protein
MGSIEGCYIHLALEIKKIEKNIAENRVKS